MSWEIIDINSKPKDSNSGVKTGNEWEIVDIKSSLPNSNSDINVSRKKKSKTDKEIVDPSSPNSDSEINVQRKKKSKIDEELERLEKLVFGDSSHIFQEEPVPSKKRKKEHTSSDSAFEDSSDVEDSVPLKPAWEDEDDVNTSIQTALELQGRPNIEHPGKPNDAYSSLLKRRFENIVGNPKWAEITEHDESEDEDSVLQRCGNFIEKRNYLSGGVLKYDKLKDLNCETRCEGKVVKSIEFHPTSTVALIAGLSGIVSLVEVDGKNNTKIQTVKFPNFDIHCARFTTDGEQFVVGSKHHRNFYSYDMMTGRSILVRIPDKSGITKMENFEMSPDGKIIAACGRFGNIYLLSAKTKEVIGSLKMNGDVRGICFNQDGSKLYSHGDEGKVYVWNMNNRSYTHRFVDDGCLKGTSICISPHNQLLACGSSSGIVNLYNTSTAFESNEPKPLKILYNLKTPITALKFNHSSELLALASLKQDKAVRLMHFPSLTVYKNFPNVEKISGLPNCVSFSPQSGYMAIGNNVAKAELYRLNYFGSY